MSQRVHTDWCDTTPLHSKKYHSGKNVIGMIISSWFVLTVFATLGGYAQSAPAVQIPQVPHKMQFAGITLTIRDDARREIQKDVDALRQSPKHFAIKAERAKTYFPIIEKIFEEERVPVDFKYLVLQESALIPDAVSPSNAVGFWQFKDFTAMEMGLRVDKQIDERMNIASASRGAARYIKKNNFYFNNWVYALQSYQMGAGAVMKSVQDTESGAKHMEVSSKTYWYVKKFLAHKVAFDDATNAPGQIQVVTFESKTKKSLTDLAKEVSVDEELLRDYNKWIRAGFIPDDRTYVVLIPLMNGKEVKLPTGVVSGNAAVVAAHPNVGVAAIATVSASATKINGVQTIVAVKGESAANLALKGGVLLVSFLKWNDLTEADSITPGETYFLARKRARATEAYHRVQQGETLWTISQKYGVQLKKLKKYNRLESGSVTPGETLWLSAKRPKDAGKIDSDAAVVQVDNSETFNWAADPVTQSDVLPTKIETPVHIEPPVEAVGIAEEVPMTDSIKTPTPIQETVAPEKDSVFSITVKKTEHVVVAGETLYAIAHKNGVGVMDLVNWNSLDLQHGIKVGQILKLSDSQHVAEDEKVSQPEEIVHEVRMNDTLYSVARKYGVTIKELMEWNEKKDFSVTVGEKLRVIRK
jgi:membrane-bound lytic murein transglycosylase D